MKKLLVLVILILSSLFPVSAQYDQDDIGQAFCVHIEIRTDATGMYLIAFLYQDDFNNYINNGVPPPIRAQVTEPNTTLVFNVIVPPQTAFGVATPNGVIEVYNFEDGSVYTFWGGKIVFRSGDMDTECLGAATDGRINRFDQQMLAVIYHDGNGGYDVWAVDPATSEGRFDYNVSRAEVDAGLAAAASGWQELGSGSTSTLYAAADGQCVLNSPNAGGEMQTFVFDCTAEAE